MVSLDANTWHLATMLASSATPRCFSNNRSFAFVASNAAPVNSRTTGGSSVAVGMAVMVRRKQTGTTHHQPPDTHHAGQRQTPRSTAYTKPSGDGGNGGGCGGVIRRRYGHRLLAVELADNADELVVHVRPAGTTQNSTSSKNNC